MSSQIDILLEDYLMGYKVDGHILDVFVNPSKAEMREVMRSATTSLGVIMDRKNNKLYAFNRDKQIHSQVWRKISGGDSRKLYKTDEILTAEFDKRFKKEWNYSSQAMFTDDIETLRTIIRADWSFFKKWIPNIEKDVWDKL
jgi:hypothetical protein